VAHTGWHWMLDRGEELAKYPLPKLDAAFLASLMRGMMAALILTGFVCLVSGFIRRLLETKDAFTEKALVKNPSPERR
jgi:hypothetical protein